MVGADSVRWESYSESGALLGRFHAPSALRIVRASLDEIWTVEANELDVPFVVRKRVVW